MSNHERVVSEQQWSEKDTTEYLKTLSIIVLSSSLLLLLFLKCHTFTFFFLLYTLSDSVTAIESASKHSTMKISRSYVNLRVIQVFFSLLILFKALSNVCTYNVFSSIHSSAKREESKMKVLRKFIAIF